MSLARGSGGEILSVGPRTGFWAFGLALAAIGGSGCSSPAEPPIPPGGGSRTVLDRARFENEIEPLLGRSGCAAAGDCHGGGIRGTFELSPRQSLDVDFDFAQVSLQVDAVDPTRSLLLLKPLALVAGGLPHAWKPFATRDDVDFLLLSEWTAGEEGR